MLMHFSLTIRINRRLITTKKNKYTIIELSCPARFRVFSFVLRSSFCVLSMQLYALSIDCPWCSLPPKFLSASPNCSQHFCPRFPYPPSSAIVFGDTPTPSTPDGPWQPHRNRIDPIHCIIPLKCVCNGSVQLPCMTLYATSGFGGKTGKTWISNF